VLALDQGSTNTKGILVSASGAVVAEASAPVAERYPRPGWVEQDAEELWRSVLAVIDGLPAELRAPGVIAGIGVCNQRETILMWERATGMPAGPVVSWQCTRGAPMCRDLAERGLDPWLRDVTGLTISPIFSATKASWLVESAANGRARAAAGELCIGTVDAWLVWKLSGGRAFVCDAGNAARTQLLNLARVDWDDDLLDLYGVPRAALPDVRPSSEVYAPVRDVPGLVDGVPVAGAIGDSHGALFGHRGFAPGTVKTTIGTGASVVAGLPELAPAPSGLLTTIAWYLDAPLYAHEGVIMSTGSAIGWLGDLLGLEDAPSRIAALAEQASTADRTVFVPAFGGLSAPYWDTDAEPVISGLDRATGVPELARAAVDSTAFQVNDLLSALDGGTGSLQTLFVDGGASVNASLLQLLADLSGLMIKRPVTTHVSALGAAYLAGLATGVWSSLDELARLPTRAVEFQPGGDARDRAARLERWQLAVRRARLVADPSPYHATGVGE
jgi:glycerol kinase